MLNGNCCNPLLLQGNCRSTISETCAFDSLLILCIQGIVMSDHFRCSVDDSKTPFKNLCLKIIDDDKLLQRHYEERFNILREIPIIKKIKTTIYIQSYNSRVNVSHLSEFLLEKLSPSVTTVKKCHS